VADDKGEEMNLFRSGESVWILMSSSAKEAGAPWVRILDGPLDYDDAWSRVKELRDDRASYEHGVDIFLEADLDNIPPQFEVIPLGTTDEQFRRIRLHLARRSPESAPDDADGEIWDPIGLVAVLRGHRVFTTSGIEAANMRETSSGFDVYGVMPPGDTRYMGHAEVHEDPNRPNVQAVLRTEGPLGYLTADGNIHKFLPGEGVGYGDLGIVGSVRAKPNVGRIPKSREAARLLAGGCDLVSRNSFPLLHG
jgi:hypothetical protein